MELLLMLVGFFILGMVLCELGVPLWVALLIGLGISYVIDPMAAEAAPLLASGNTVTGYVAIIVTFAVLVALGIFFGKRDRAKIKADLIPKVEPKKVITPKPAYRIREFRKKTESGVVSVFKVQKYIVEYTEWSTYRYWQDLSDEFTHLAAAEAWLVKHLEVIRQLNVPTLNHEYTDNGDPIPPAPELAFPSKG